jgi:3-methyladenine DNA glycosylase AlkD
MNTKQARELSHRVWDLVLSGQIEPAFACLQPVLAEAVPFRLLDIIGTPPYPVTPETFIPFIEKIASTQAMGGWVIIGSALGSQIQKDLEANLALARCFIEWADVWYGVDSIGERVPGPALLHDFSASLVILAAWRNDENRWLRRATGVATHFWAKRARGSTTSIPQARLLLEFLEPVFEESNRDAIKGIGWGIKTLGRYYPNLVTDWLVEQVGRGRRHYSALMLRKAMTYLPEESKTRIAGSAPRIEGKK